MKPGRSRRAAVVGSVEAGAAASAAGRAAAVAARAGRGASPAGNIRGPNRRLVFRPPAADLSGSGFDGNAFTHLLSETAKGNCPDGAAAGQGRQKAAEEACTQGNRGI